MLTKQKYARHVHSGWQKINCTLVHLELNNKPLTNIKVVPVFSFKKINA